MIPLKLVLVNTNKILEVDTEKWVSEETAKYHLVGSIGSIKYGLFLIQRSEKATFSEPLGHSET